MNLSEQTKKDIDRAFRALEALDEIRAEIEQIRPYELPKDERTPQGMIDKVLDIIDRYRNEVSE